MNYFKIAFKNLRKNPGISIINLSGLSIGLAVCGLIALFVQHETSFDRFHPEYQNVYRLNTTFKYPNSPERPTAMASAKMGPFFKRESAEVEDFVRIVAGNEDFLVRSGERSAGIEKSIEADPSFFDFFNFPLRYGDKKTAFDNPNNILITREISEKLFGFENPIGRTLDYTFAYQAGIDTTVHYLISGVFETLPDNTHLKFDALMPLDPRRYDAWDASNQWHGVTTNTYLRLRRTVQNPAQVAAAFPALLLKEMPNSEMIGLDLQPLATIHLESMHLEYDLNNFEKADLKYVLVLALVAILILLIGGINFTNLSMVVANRRMKEIAVRKSIGASRIDVLRQFLGESLFLASIAGVLAMGWIKLFGPAFCRVLDRDLNLEWHPSFVAGMAGTVLLLGLLAGIFPALRMSGFSASAAFQNKTAAGSVRQPFVKGLVILQFSLSVLLIIGMLVCYRQLWFLRHADLGYSTSQVIEIDLGPGNYFKYPVLKESLKNIPGVQDVSGSSHSLGAVDSQNGVLIRSTDTRRWENYVMNIIRADRNFFELYGMTFVAGTAPDAEGALKERQYVVNESFVRKVGWKDDPIGKEIIRAGLPETEVGRVVGVVKDFHHNSLHRLIEPICIQASQATTLVSVKIGTADIPETLSKIGAVYSGQITDRPFDYEFLDDHFAALYAAEARLGKSLLAAAALAILIACMGLLALSAFIIQQRTKEIGVRKVLGATVAGVVLLLSRDFLKLVLVSFLIASPIAYYVLNQWLDGFAYRMELSVWLFALAGALALGIALLTVGVHSMRAALANPVKSLRSE